MDTRAGWSGTQLCQVRTEAGETLPALAFTAVVGEVRVADRVLLNVNALERGLGTGGQALVVAVPDRLPPDSDPGPGHLVKARYTPQQAMVFGVDEQDSPHHALLADADDLSGMPVVVADLHSSLPAVVAGIRADRPDAQVAYLMTDGGALPAALSSSAAGLRAAGWLTCVLTTGQAFGGDLEAATVHSGLLAAHLVVQADVAVVIQGPGNLGTGTRWGFSGVAAGEALNAVATLGGRGVAALRVSGADPRERHTGISHHSRTAYGRVLQRPADLVVPELHGVPGVADTLAARVVAEAERLLEESPHLRGVRVPVTDLLAALASCPVPLSTMGRGMDQDPAAFLAAAAAGRHAARLTATEPS